MITLIYNIKNDVIELKKNKRIIISLNSEEFRELIHGVKLIMEQVSSKLKKKNEKKAEKKRFVMAIKMLSFAIITDITYSLFALIRKIKNLFFKTKNEKKHSKKTKK